MALGCRVFEVRARQNQNRCSGRVGLAEGRQRRQIAGQVGECGVKRGLHVARGTFDTAVEIELDSDTGSSER